MKKLTLFLISILFLFTPKIALAFPKESHVTFTIPVRGHEDWALEDQDPLDFPLFYYQQSSQSGIPTSYMLRYDALEDQEISSRLKDLVATDSAQILGGLLEVTPKLAQKADVEYQNHGRFDSGNRLFLSGYTREDRRILIDTFMQSFFEKFGNYPPVVGVDSIDAYSFEYLVSHYSVIGVFTQDETYQNGNLRQWGSIYGTPYLPSKTNILVPAQNTKNKINGVVFRWLPSDPQSFYQKDLGTNLFLRIPGIYEVFTQKDFNESTHFNIRIDNDTELGLPTLAKEGDLSGKELTINLINSLKGNQEKYTFRFKSTSEMGEIIKARYPETSPASYYQFATTQDDKSYVLHWYQNPYYRLVLRQDKEKTDIVSFVVYNPSISGNYYHQKNIDPVTSQEIVGIIDSAKYEKSSLSLNIDLSSAEFTSEYWDLIIKDKDKTIRLEPQKIIFSGLLVDELDTDQIKVEQKKDTTTWLINPTKPFSKLSNTNWFVMKIIITFLIIFIILKSFIKKPPFTIFLGLAFGFLALIPVIFSGQIYSFGLGFWGPNGHDAIFHLSVINSLKDSLVKLSHPQLLGSFLKNYHIGLDWLLALVSKVTNIEPTVLFFRWLPIALVVVIVTQLIKLSSYLKLSKVGTRLVLFLSFLTGSLGFVYHLAKSGTLFAGESLFWMNQSASIFLNPPFALSIALLLIFINLYSSKKTSKFLTLVLIGGLLAQVKVYAFILLVLALVIKKEFRLVLGIGLIGLLISLPTLGLQGSPFVFSPLWFPRSLVAAQDKLDLARLAQAWQVYEINSVYLKLFLVNVFALVIYLLGNLGIRVIGLLNILKKEPQDKTLSLLKYISILGLIIPLLFIQKSNPWNTIQFSYYSLFFLGLFTAKTISPWLDSSKNKVSQVIIGWTLLLLFTLPTTIGTLKDYVTPYSASKISFTELHALDTLKSQPPGVVVSPVYHKDVSKPFPEPKSLYAYTSTAYISALSGQQEYLADLINLDITGFNYQERSKNVQRLYRTNDSIWVKDFLKEANIKYVYQTPASKLSIDPDKACLTPLFDSGEVVIYTFNCPDGQDSR
jgi:hypothetical protein